MTPFGARLRALRRERGATLADLAAAIQVSSAYLSALEHGRRGTPSAGLVHQVCEFFGLIWDDADDLARLARASRPRVVLDTAGLSPEATEFANALADRIRTLSPGTLAAMRALLAREGLHPFQAAHSRSGASASTGVGCGLQTEFMCGRPPSGKG